MKIAYFAHSFRSCWNHGNAHFIRGMARELAGRGHEVRAYEPAGGWSLANLLAAEGAAALLRFHACYPDLKPVAYGEDMDPVAELDEMDVVIVHEWNEPELVASLARARRLGAGFLLLLHDTHHRLASDPRALAAFDLDGFDGVLAFGQSLARLYERRGWGRHVFVWHEAADTSLFRPPQAEAKREGVIWIGNWGDGERAEEIETYLLRPAAAAGLGLDIHGVRYPEHALETLVRHGARYGGWLANTDAPEAYARHMATVHVPRRPYTEVLPGIPTIRMFEAMACGIPLVCAPWTDAEHLFRPGTDYLEAEDGDAMARHLAALAGDPDLRRSLARNGLETIAARHTCRHRADELLAIVDWLRRPQRERNLA
ncbi:MAG: glycosyltransferase [Alphaproteobacteria bacterium]